MQGGLTFLFSDIEGSTRLVDELQSGYGLALRVCRRTLINALANHGGREFGNEGDGQFFVVPDPVAAARAALDAQARIDEAEWSGGIKLRVRMGIHCGPVRMSGGEYVGTTVHEVARICAAANGGQVLCSADVAREIRGADGLDVWSLGHYILRGIPVACELYQVGAIGTEPELAPPREAVREGGRRFVLWRRGDESSAALSSTAEIRWTPTVPGVEVGIRCRVDAGVEIIQLIVSRDGVIEEEYDGLTLGGACDVASVVNANSQLISIKPTSA